MLCFKLPTLRRRVREGYFGSLLYRRKYMLISNTLCVCREKRSVCMLSALLLELDLLIVYRIDYSSPASLFLRKHYNFGT